MKKSIVLLSGGIDSSVALAHKVQSGSEVIAVSFDYGQTHRGQELSAARRIAKRYEVEHRIVGLASAFIPSALTGYGEIPSGHADSPDATLVPGRNMVMIGVGASIAQACQASSVVIGCNRDDWNGYPDCRPEFIRYMWEATQVATEGAVSLQAPFLTMSKSQVVQQGRKMGVPLGITWSCYRGGDSPCRRCGACESRDGAL